MMMMMACFFAKKAPNQLLSLCSFDDFSSSTKGPAVMVCITVIDPLAAFFLELIKFLPVDPWLRSYAHSFVLDHNHHEHHFLLAVK